MDDDGGVGSASNSSHDATASASEQAAVTRIALDAFTHWSTVRVVFALHVVMFLSQNALGAAPFRRHETS